ncbi:translation initiation factor IF-2 [Porphyromonas pogonae]|uniref:translation initiation factor IF-2 n=1 Tax=Porphyromonas pogonae TaxID=867595 RepID=UPI002E793F5C|nr:translation initiation factor IF-2 [Porphyromonas pogonae]
MSKIKLFSLAKELNVGVASLTESLQKKGFEVETGNPNVRIGRSEFDLLLQEFGKNLSKTEKERICKKFLRDDSSASPHSTVDNNQNNTHSVSSDKTGNTAPVGSKVQEIATVVPEDLKPKINIKGHLNDQKDLKQNEAVKTDSNKPIVEKSDALEAKPLQKQAEKVQEVKQTGADTSKNIEASPKEPLKEVQKKETVKEEKKSSTPIQNKSVHAESIPNKTVQEPKNNLENKDLKSKKYSDQSKQGHMKNHSHQATNEKPDSKPTNQERSDKPKVTVKTSPSDQGGATKEPEIFRISSSKPEPSVKVVGKIDLSSINDSTRPKKKTKEERNKEKNAEGEARKKRKRINKNAVDIKSEAAKAAENSRNAQKNKPRNNNAGGNAGGANNNSGGGAQHPSHTNQNAANKNRRNNNRRPAPKPVVTEEDVQKQVKETLARLTSKKTMTGKGAKYRKDKREAARSAAQDALDQTAIDSKTIKLTEFVTVSDLANLMDVPVNQVIATCMNLGVMVSINMRLDAETINIVADEFGYKTEFVSADVVESIGQEDEIDTEEDLVPRPPIVTVMGHVDHGKTSLLDRIRNTNVIAGEAGGITQHIGAYNLTLTNGKRITFLDTPGHEAFTAMRARGAKVTDIAIIIVAADDDVMPQTKEAINHAAAAGVPIVFAINKIDKPGANTDKIKEQLANMNYLVEDWGGKYQCQEISAKQGLHIEELLEKVLLEAEMLDLKANPSKKAVGSVIESSLDKGRGYTSTVLVQNGTLRMGDIVLAGTHHGKIKAMFNERNQRIDSAGPSEPVLILGLDGAPTSGDNFNVLDSEQEARNIANKREQLQREQDNRTKKGLTLEELARRRALGNFQELNIIIKGDVDGSVEALSDSLIRLSTEEIQVNVIHKGVGQISESDVVLAAASSAIIVGFQVRPSQAARRQAEREGVEIRTYSIIYDTIEDVKSAMEGMLSPEIKEQVTANIEVRQVFKVSKVGTIAGCMVIEGKVKRTNKIRLIRDGIVKYSGELGSLKRFKDDAKEVPMGLECGLNIEGYNDIMEGDIIEAYDEIEVKKTLNV